VTDYADGLEAERRIQADILADAERMRWPAMYHVVQRADVLALRRIVTAGFGALSHDSIAMANAGVKTVQAAAGREGGEWPDDPLDPERRLAAAVLIVARQRTG
jgi:hypothetical protein